MNLKGKTVLVTGAARRIGREIARGFAARGADVLIHYHLSRREAEELAKELRRQKVKSEIYQADLLSLDEIRKMVKKILRDVGTPDILVNNAAVFFRTPFGGVTGSEWDHFFSVNLKAPFFLAQELAPAMKKRGGGRGEGGKIINMADWAGLRPYTGYLPYCISKGALITLTQGLAKTLAPEVLVTAVCPGPIVPPADMTKGEKENVAKKTLVGHWGTATDVVRTVLFLAESDFVTGSYHLVDGGELLGR